MDNQGQLEKANRDSEMAIGVASQLKVYLVMPKLRQVLYL